MKSTKDIQFDQVVFFVLFITAWEGRKCLTLQEKATSFTEHIHGGEEQVHS